MSRICWLLALTLVALASSACATGDGAERNDDTGTITVAAASSLTDAFTELGQDFERMHPGTTVRFNFGSSSVLARQIIEGAPASVFAAADQTTMDGVDDAGLVAGSPAVIARNELTLISRSDVEPPVTAVEDLDAADVVALCAVSAPCGVLSDDVLDRAGVALPADRISRAPNARATLRAVSDGDADAALVYVTDALAAADAVIATPLPAPLLVTTPYPVAVLADQPAPSVAEAFVRFLQTPPAREILVRHGFSAP